MLRSPSHRSAAEGPPSCSPHCARPALSEGAQLQHAVRPRRRLGRRSAACAARHQLLHAGSELNRLHRSACAPAILGPAPSSAWTAKPSCNTQCGWQHLPLDRRKLRHGAAVSGAGSSSPESGEHSGDPSTGADQQQQPPHPGQQRQQPPGAANPARQQSDTDESHPSAPALPKVRSVFRSLAVGRPFSFSIRTSWTGYMSTPRHHRLRQLEAEHRVALICKEGLSRL